MNNILFNLDKLLQKDNTLYCNLLEGTSKDSRIKSNINGEERYLYEMIKQSDKIRLINSGLTDDYKTNTVLRSGKCSGVSNEGLTQIM